MTPKEIKALIKLCRAQGVKSIDVNGIKLELGSAPDKPVRAAKQTSDFKEPETEQIPSEEEMLYWSTHSPVGAPSEGN